MNLCAKCIGNKTFSEWVEEKGARGSCDYDPSHGEEYPVVSINLFCDHLDKWFQENYCKGRVLPCVSENDKLYYEQQGESLDIILSQVLEAESNIIKDVIINLPEPNDIYGGDIAFYDSCCQYELIKDVRERDRQDLEDAFYDYEVVAVLENEHPLAVLEKSCDDMVVLLAEVPKLLQNLHRAQYVMIFVHAICTLESYLYHTFIRKVFSDKSYKYKYLKECPTLSAEKVFLYKILDDDKNIILEIDKKVKQKISNLPFHKLDLIKRMYRNVLDIDIGDISNLSKSINKRHDFVHRGGVGVDGKEVEIQEVEISNLVNDIRDFCQRIDNQILVTPPPSPPRG